MTKQYFFYTELCNGTTIIHRCNRSSTRISGCRKIYSGNLGHANVLDHKWGTQYFKVVGQNCFDFSGKKVANSKCNISTPWWSQDGGGLTSQGRTQYGEYRLKIYGGVYDEQFRIVVQQKQKNGNYKTIKIIKLSDSKSLSNAYAGIHWRDEPEDVMVDGDTGTIYYTKSSCFVYGCGQRGVRLYKYSGYKLPTADKNTPIASSKKNSTSGNKNSTSGSSSSSTSTSGTPTSPKLNSGCVETSVLGEGGQYCDDGKGSGTIDILKTIVDIMTVGVGILGVLGVTIVGIQYLTAGGNEEKTRKAKRRMFEIIIGLVVYVVIYFLLQWLLPGLGTS